MAKKTRATRLLGQASIDFTVQSYACDPDADSIGLQAAEALCEAPGRVLKRLMAWVDGKPACVIVQQLAPTDAVRLLQAEAAVLAA